MASQDLIEIMWRAELLSPDEQLKLIAHLAEASRPAVQQPKPRRDWREIRGSASYPLTGEDTQAWVSRTRRESDEAREHGLKRLP